MRRILALILVFLAANLLFLIIFWQTTEKSFLNPDFFIRNFKQFNFYQTAIDQGSSLLAQNQTALALLNSEQAKKTLASIVSPSYLETQTENFLRNFFFWFNSDDLASDLKAVISLKEPKEKAIQETQKIFGASAALQLSVALPNELDLTQIDGEQARQTQDVLKQVRYYYFWLHHLEKVIWGGIALFLIFIVLLLVDSLRLIIRYLGKVVLLAGIELTVATFAIPIVVGRLLFLTPLPAALNAEFYQVLSEMSAAMAGEALNGLKIFAYLFLGAGFFLLLISFLIQLQEKRKVKALLVAPPIIPS